MRPGSSSIQSGFTLLSALEESDHEWIFTTGSEQPTPAGAVIVTEGVRGEFIYFVLDGLFAVSSAALGGREIARLGPGQIFGEMSFLEDRPTSATISAIEDSRVLAVSRDQLEARLAAAPGMAARFYKALAVIAAGRLRELLGTLARWMEAEDRLPVAPEVLERWQQIADRTQRFKQQILQADKSDAAAADLPGALAEFSKFVTAAIGDASVETVDARDELGARIQREILPYLLKSVTVERLYYKPRGYPCDYETLALIAADQPAGTRQLGALLDRAFLQLPVIRAVRHRKDALVTAIGEAARSASAGLRVTGIGCGAADPLFDAFTASDQAAMTGTIIDFDTHGLGAAETRRKALRLDERVQLVSTNIVRLVSGRGELEVEEQDVIYGLTVADYLDDRLLLRFLNQAWRKLRPGGQLLLSGLHRSNPDRAFLDHVIDWKAAHRSEEEMNALFNQSNFQSPASHFGFDREKITFLAACRKG